MNKRRIFINVISSGGQVILVGVTYLFLYKFLLKSLGIELLGVWSVVLATSSLANLANFGVATSVVRFVALYSDDNKNIKRLIFTASNFLLILFLALSIIIYPFSTLILNHIIGAKYLEISLSILPYSLSCLIINEVGGVYASVLDGLQKNYIRSIIFTLSTILFLLLSYYLTPIMGIKGVALAQVLQSVFTFTCCLTLLISKTKYNPLTFNWDKAIFRQIFTYGMKFQFLSITAMLCDPVTKALLTKFGGLNFTGFYEMASRLINQVKGIIVNANQSLVPVIIDVSKKEQIDPKVLYKTTVIIIYYFSLFIFSSIIIFSRDISLIWIGSIQPFFTYCIFLLGICAFVNLLCNPAYFSSIATGHLNILIYSQVMMAIGNLILGYVGGYFFSAHGVVLGWIVAGAMSSIYLIYIYQKGEKITLFDIFKLADFLYFLIIIIILIVCKLMLRYNNLVMDVFAFGVISAFFIYKSYIIYKKRRIYFNLAKG